MIGYTPIQFEPHPGRTLPEQEKNTERYALAVHRHMRSQVKTDRIDWYRWNCHVNRSFYRGDQWGFREDVDTFLKDADNNERVRIKVVSNMVKPVVEQFRGQVERMTIGASVTPTTYRAKTRRETKLMRSQVLTMATGQGGAMGEIIQKNAPVGATTEETTKIFDNYYQDDFVSATTDLMIRSAELNKFKEDRLMHGGHLTFSGACWSHAYTHGHHQRFSPIQPEDIIFDTSMKRLDCSDARFLGFDEWTGLEEIAERDDITPAQLAMLEKGIRDRTASVDGDGKDMGALGCYVSTMYWKDVRRKDMGYVPDDEGRPMLVPVDYVAPGETEPKYKSEQCVDPPDNARNRKLFKGKRVITRYAQVIRYCKCIFNEFAPMKLEGQDPTGSAKVDLVLDHGLYLLQEADPDETDKVALPIKGAIYAIEDGYIISPINDIISPQRFKNRMLSAMEGFINIAGGAGNVWDLSFVDPKVMDIKQIRKNAKNGQDVFLNSRGKGLPNVFGNYDNTLKAGVYQMAHLLTLMDQIGQGSTGVHDPMTGDPGQQRQLVRTTAMLIQRGGIMQEPFFAALANLEMQKYQHIAQAGRQWYNYNPDKLEELIGDKYSVSILMSSGLMLEQMRAHVERNDGERQATEQANDLLNFLVTNQMIDRMRYADLFGRSHVSDVLKAMREFAQDQERAMQQQRKDQAAMAEMQGAAAQQAELQRQGEDLHKQLIDQAQKQADRESANAGLYAREDAKKRFGPEKAAAQPVGV